MVPPALVEVGQLVLERVLHHLEHEREHHAEPPVAHHQSLRIERDDAYTSEAVDYGNHKLKSAASNVLFKSVEICIYKHFTSAYFEPPSE